MSSICQSKLGLVASVKQTVTQLSTVIGFKELIQHQQLLFIVHKPRILPCKVSLVHPSIHSAVVQIYQNTSGSTGIYTVVLDI